MPPPAGPSTSRRGDGGGSLPPPPDPEAKESLARLYTVPHGNSVCAVGFPQYVVPKGLPTIPPANTVPFPIGGGGPPPRTANPHPAYDPSFQTPLRPRP